MLMTDNTEASRSMLGEGVLILTQSLYRYQVWLRRGQVGLGRNKKVVQGKVGRHVLVEGLEKRHQHPSKSQQRCSRGNQMDAVRGEPKSKRVVDS